MSIIRSALRSIKGRLALSVVSAIVFIAVAFVLFSYFQWSRDVSLYRPLSQEDVAKCAAVASEAVRVCAAEQEARRSRGATVSESGQIDYELIGCRLGHASEKLGETLRSRCSQSPPAPFYRHIANTGHHVYDDGAKAALLLLIISTCFFGLFTAAALFMSEQNLGWRRLSLVIASIASAFGFASWLATASQLDGEAIGFAGLFAVCAFPVALLFVLGGRATASWVRIGFGQDGRRVHPDSIAARPSADSSSSPNTEHVLPDTAPISERDKIIATPLAGPWRRFWARIIDLWLLSLPVGLGVGIVLNLISPDFISSIEKYGSPNYAFGWICLPAVLLAEAIFFGIFGNTPGKALLGLRVTTVGAAKPSFNDYLSRLVGVYWFGLATGFPIISFFTMFRQYNHVTGGRQTGYDSGRFNVRGHRIGFFRSTVAAVVVFILLGVVPSLLKEFAQKGVN
jgi:uncharacterized RDD family membrane protein YckC